MDDEIKDSKELKYGIFYKKAKPRPKAMCMIS